MSRRRIIVTGLLNQDLHFNTIPPAILLTPICLARSPKEFVWLSTISLLLFLLWSKGWSPQWATLVIPFLLLSYPNQRGLKLILLLTLIVFIEWPLADALQSRALLAVSIIARTLLFIATSVMLLRKVSANSAASLPLSIPDE